MGLVAVSVVVGPIWRVISPVRTLWRLLPTGRGDREWGHRYPTPVPHHPGILAGGAGLVGVRVAGTGKSRPGSLSAIKIWILCYLVAMFAGAAVFGPRWFARADPFEVYSVTVSRLAPFRRNRDTGAIVVGNPLDHLPTMPVRPAPSR